MSKRCDLNSIGMSRAILAVVVFAVVLSGPAYCSAASLLLQQAPVSGGQINLGTGIHQFELNAEVALVATPKAGYQFMYWLGNVSDPTSASTTVYLDGPKIIIAVYERIGYEFSLDDDIEGKLDLGGGGGGSGLRRNAADYSRQGGGGGGRKRPHKYGPPVFEEPEPEQDFPVPGDDTEVPEPVTGVLLGLGSLLAIRRRKKT